MNYPFDDYSDFDGSYSDFDGSYSYGLTEKQIQDRMDYAINGNELEDDLDFGDLFDDEDPDDE